MMSGGPCAVPVGWVAGSEVAESGALPWWATSHHLARRRGAATVVVGTLAWGWGDATEG
ncbi:MAG: hypothetical protein H6R22_1275, partial [Chromatiaceae bacterium]|nr:hypothetical protein [Chromatiaceae bacterium]